MIAGLDPRELRALLHRGALSLGPAEDPAHRALVTAATLLLGYPLALWLVRIRVSRKGLLLLLVLFPWLTSVIIRTYAWMIILGNQGLLNQLLGLLGAGPVRLLWQETGVIVGLVYVMLPLMVIPLYNSISQVDRRTEDAARTLGRHRWRSSGAITWPLTRPGLVSGCLLVFIVTLGSYVTPALLGGPRETVMPMLIEQQVTVLHYPFAAALGVILLGIVLLVATVFNRYLAARLTATHRVTASHGRRSFRAAGRRSGLSDRAARHDRLSPRPDAGRRRCCRSAPGQLLGVPAPGASP